jgi:MraZ protein
LRFVGTHERPVDERGRLMLPPEYRRHFASGLVLTKGQERCLYVFEMEEFWRTAERLGKTPGAAKSVRLFSRVFFGSASFEDLDKQGRITINPGLRAYAALKGMCAVIGVNTRLEIWPLAGWQNYLADQEDAFAAVAEDVLPGILSQED